MAESIQTTSGADDLHVEGAFYLPKPGDLAFTSIRELADKASEPILEIARAFLNNLEAVLWIAALPEFVAHHGAAALAEQQIFFRETAAERACHLRKLAARVRDGLDTSDVREDKEAVRKNVEEAMKDEAPRIHQHSLQMLGGLLTADEGLAGAPFELLRQSTVLCWSALEVLASDSFARLLNKCPKLAVKLNEDDSARKLFAVKSLSLDMIAEYGFDMSDRMGDFFLQHSTIDSVVRMKTVFGALFPEAENLRRSLEERAMWMLYHRRNLIVHRRSVVDAYYLAKSGDSLQLGSRLIISPLDLKSYVDCVGSAGCQIITAADGCFKHLTQASG